MFRNSAVALLVLTSLCFAQNPHPSLPVAGADGLFTPSGIAVDSAGNVYIADAVHHRVQRVSHGAASTVAGTGVIGFAGDGGPATDAALNSPTAIAIDSDGSLYIADAGNHRVRRVANGIITTIAGSGGSGSDGDHGPATKAAIGHPQGVAVNSAGTVFIAAEGRVRRVADGVISTIAGTGLIGVSGDDGPAVNAAMDPRALAVDTEGNLYIADEAAGRVRRVYKGIVSTVAIGRPLGLAVDGHGVLYFADAADKRIRRVLNGAVTVVAGESEPVTATTLAVAPDGNLIVADEIQSSVRTLLPAATPVISSVVTAYAGATLSQNAWVEIRGTGLVPTSTPSNGQDWSKAPEFSSGRMPTSLNGISVTVNGIPAYIYFYCSSATDPQCPLDQINVLTPLDNTQGTIPVVVNNNGTRSAAYNSTLRSSAPSFFQWADRYAVATHVNNTGVGPTSLFPGYSTPARPNEPIVLWMTGFGLPGTGLTQGSSTQRGNLSFTPVIQFNGITAAVSFAAVISPGLYQINLTVPSNVPSGDVPVTVSYNGVTGPATNYITISGGTAPPAISSFSANPLSINAGQSATLNWNVANANSLSIDNGIGAVTGTSHTVNPTTTTTYKLTATNGAGSVSASTTVTVSATPAPTINSFTATSTTITAGQSTTLSWNVSNATSVTIDNGIGAVAASGSKSVSPAAGTTYTLSATSGGVTRTASVTVSVQSACSITGAAASDTYFISNSSTLSKGSWWVQGFTLSSKTNFQLRVATDYTAQTAVFASDQLNAFTNNGSFQAFALFDNKFGTQSLTLNTGSYYVGIRNTSSATSNQYGLELDYAMNIPGLSYIDTYLSQASTVGANGGKVWQPFTIQCGFRYLMDGGNSGLKTYIIPADQLAGFQNNQGFKFYTDYSSDFDDTAQPGYYEVKLPAGDYYLVFWNDTDVTKAITYIMERWR